MVNGACQACDGGHAYDAASGWTCPTGYGPVTGSGPRCCKALAKCSTLAADQCSSGEKNVTNDSVDCAGTTCTKAADENECCNACDDGNCEMCKINAGFCTKCKAGYKVVNGACQECDTGVSSDSMKSFQCVDTNGNTKDGWGAESLGGCCKECDTGVSQDTNGGKCVDANGTTKDGWVAESWGGCCKESPTYPHINLRGCCQTFTLQSDYTFSGDTLKFEREASSFYKSGNLWKSPYTINGFASMVYESDSSHPTSQNSWSLNNNGGSYNGHRGGSFATTLFSTGVAEHTCPDTLVWKAWSPNYDGNGNNWAPVTVTCITPSDSQAPSNRRLKYRKLITV